MSQRASCTLVGGTEVGEGEVDREWDDELQFVASGMVDICGAHAGERGGGYGVVVDSGVPGGTVEGRAAWSVAGGDSHVVVGKGVGEGGGVVFGWAPVAGTEHCGECFCISIVVEVHGGNWSASSW